MPHLTLALLGAFQAKLDDTPITGFESNKVRAFLAYLAIENDRPHARETLAGLLWPDFSNRDARRNLRLALSNLRQTIGDHHANPPFLLITRDTIQFNTASDHSLDVTPWLQQIAFQSPTSNLQSLIFAYRGKFLDGFSCNSAPFEEWVLLKREQIGQRVLRALCDLTARAEERGEYECVQTYARQQIELEPWDEQAHQQLMRALAYSGQRCAALAQYETCRRLLKQDLKVEPSHETIALYDSIREGKLGQAQAMPRDNLPIPLTSFIGRQNEMAEVKRLVTTTRWLTLTGAGGCGKTRLALQVAQDLRGATRDLEGLRFPDGVWWVELAGLSDPALVTQAVALVFNLSESPEMPLLTLLTNYLHAKKMLLIVDNCEHLLGACAQLIGTLLSTCPKLQIVATSREPLNISGEVVWRVPSLASPEVDVARSLPLAQLRQYDAIRLFAERATMVATNWRLEENTALVTQVCARLDGIPLAIELATARLRVLSTEQIAARLDDRFTLLTGGSRNALRRHQTLRATMDWSYDLLSDAERALLRRLSVFAGGWTLEAAEQVCSGQWTMDSNPTTDHRPLFTILDLLTSLIDKSLVVVETCGNVTRYRLLETVRQYAREKLNAANEVEMMRARHRDFFVKLGEDAGRKLKGPDTKEWTDRLETEYDNIRAVFEYAMVNDVAAAVRLAWSLVMFWVWRGYLIEGRALMLQLLARPELQGANRLRLHVLKTIGCLQVYLNDSVAVRSYFEEGLSLAKLLGDESDIAFTLQGMGRALILLSAYPTARPFIESSLVLYRKIGERWGEAHSLNSLGTIVYQLGEHEHGQVLLEESVGVFQSIGDICGSAESLAPLGRFARNRGDYARAIELYSKCLEIDRQMDFRHHVGIAMLGLGLTVLQQGDYRRAVEVYTQVLEVLKRRGSPTMFVQWLIAIAQISRGFGKPTAAARLLGAADTAFAPFRIKGFSMPVTHELYARISNNVRVELGDETFAQHWQVGRTMTLEQAIEFALELSQTFEVLETPKVS